MHGPGTNATASAHAAAAVRAPLLRDLVGKEVGRFRVRERLGSGGGGEVFLAEDTGLKRPVALKRITTSSRAGATSHGRLWKEAELASRLDHPHVAAVYDVIEDAGEIFVVMEYVEGETLRERLRNRFTLADFLPIAAQCASALAAAHQVGLVHRDVKPENIMLTPDGQVKMLDFGLARELPGPDATTESETQNEGFSGTLYYMAPEALEQQRADARTDIFSLGVVFYEALAGKNPFQRSGFLAACNAILYEKPPPLRQQNREVPEELERIVSRMLAKRPDDRYASAADLRVDLETVERNVKTAAARPELPARAPRTIPVVRLKKFGAVALGTAALLVGIVAGVDQIYRHFRVPLLDAGGAVLLADFENRTDRKIFDGTVTEAVRQSLEQSRYLRLVPRAQVAEAERRMGRSGTAALDPILGQEICQREDFRALLAGRIAPYGSKYRITAQVIDPWRGEPVLVEQASLASPSELYPAVDELTQKLRQHLGESLKQIEEHAQPLQRVTTTSLEALQRYSRAMQRYAAGDLEGFLPLVKGAIELDPEFAMAHFYLGSAYDSLGESESGRQELALARRSIDRVTERERHLILGAEYDHQGIYEKGAEQYRLITQLYPNDAEAYQWLANSAAWAGHAPEAIAAAQRAVQLDPRNAVSYQQLMRLQVEVNDFPAALATYESAQKQGMKSPVLHYVAGLAYFGEDNLAAARREFEALQKEGGDYEANLASLYLARVLIYEGRLHEGSEALRAGFVLDEKAHSEGWLLVRRFLLAKALWALGEKTAARKEAAVLEDSALQRRQPLMRWAQAEEMRRAGALAFEQGNVAGARRILARMKQLPSLNESDYTKSCYYNLKGLVAGADGQLEDAAESERRAALFFAGYEPYRALGDAYAARRDWANAAKAYERYLGFKGQVLRDGSSSDWVLAHLSLARALAQAGDSRRSLEQYEQFLRLWAHADADVAAVRAARAERERLRSALQRDSSSVPGMKAEGK